MSDQKEPKHTFVSLVPTTGTFLNVLEAKAVKKNGKETGDPKFSSNFEFNLDHPELDALKKLALKAAKEKWPDRAIGSEASKKDKNGNPKQPTFVFPWTLGDDLANNAKKRGKDREFSRGKLVLTARSKYEPRLSVVKDGRMVDLEDEAARKAAKNYFYTGVDCLFQVSFQAYDGVGVNSLDGVTAYLDHVVSLNKGEKLLKGGPSAAEVFKGYVGTTTDEDPTAGVEDDEEIPF